MMIKILSRDKENKRPCGAVLKACNLESELALSHGPEQVSYLVLPQFPNLLDEHNVATRVILRSP